jgi:hypothetical protein
VIETNAGGASMSSTESAMAKLLWAGAGIETEASCHLLSFDVSGKDET